MKLKVNIILNIKVYKLIRVFKKTNIFIIIIIIY